MSVKPATVRIGNAQAFWGDRCDAAAELLAQEPELDYLTMDYLAEVSMSILTVQRERDANLGYARDFVEVVAAVAPYWAAGGRCKLIANAGGLNPHGCAAACKKALEAVGCRAMKIAVVSGDDVLSSLKQPIDDGQRRQFQNLDTGAPISDVADRLMTANAYVGSLPMVEALRGGAEIVITGRVADPSLVVAACWHHFGWSETDWNRLAGATVAGHLIECGTQVTGGISTDWLEIPDPTHIGFPIVEVADDGSCVVTKPQASGGIVSEWTVKEQLLYEIGDPGNYLSPDVAVSFLSLKVEEVGRNRVRVSGAEGKPRPQTLKVSATYRDGYRAAGTLTIIGENSAAKAKRCGEIVLKRLQEAGQVLRSQVIELMGSESETILRIAVEAESKGAVERFSKELMPLITSGPPGTTGYAEGRPRVHAVFRYWPCLIARTAVESRIELIETSASPSSKAQLEAGQSRSDVRTETSERANAGLPVGPTPATPQDVRRLQDIACGRSGDKGIGANVGIIARRVEYYAFLKEWLTVERIQEFFAADGVDAVTRYEMPNLSALNFVLRGVLRRSLQTDAQGKALAQRLLQMRLPE